MLRSGGETQRIDTIPAVAPSPYAGQAGLRQNRHWQRRRPSRSRNQSAKSSANVEHPASELANQKAVSVTPAAAAADQAAPAPESIDEKPTNQKRASTPPANKRRPSATDADALSKKPVARERHSKKLSRPTAAPPHVTRQQEPVAMPTKQRRRSRPRGQEPQQSSCLLLPVVFFDAAGVARSIVRPDPDARGCDLRDPNSSAAYGCVLDYIDDNKLMGQRKAKHIWDWLQQVDRCRESDQLSDKECRESDWSAKV